MKQTNHDGTQSVEYTLDRRPCGSGRRQKYSRLLTLVAAYGLGCGTEGSVESKSDTPTGIAPHDEHGDHDDHGDSHETDVGDPWAECNPELASDAPCAEDPLGIPIMFPLGSPKGSCRYGAKACTDGWYGPCWGAIGPLPVDRCDIPGNDDDCDGVPNTNCAGDNGDSGPGDTDTGGDTGGNSSTGTGGETGGETGTGGSTSGSSEGESGDDTTCEVACARDADCGPNEACMGTSIGSVCLPTACWSCWRTGGSCSWLSGSCEFEYCTDPPTSSTCDKTCRNDRDCSTGEACLDLVDSGKVCWPASCTACFGLGQVCSAWTTTCTIDHCGDVDPKPSDSCRGPCKSQSDCASTERCLSVEGGGNMCLAEACSECFGDGLACSSHLWTCAFAGC